MFLPGITTLRQKVSGQKQETSKETRAIRVILVQQVLKETLASKALRVIKGIPVPRAMTPSPMSPVSSRITTELLSMSSIMKRDPISSMTDLLQKRKRRMRMGKTSHGHSLAGISRWRTSRNLRSSLPDSSAFTLVRS